MTVILFITGRKGGTAKSTLARNLADGCAREGLRTIVVDADSQHTLTYTMQVAPVDALMTLLTEDTAEWADLLIQVPEAFSGGERDYFYLLPTYEGLAQIEGQAGIQERVYERFSELYGFVDVVIVDGSPGASNLHAGFYQVANAILLPCQPELESILGLNATLNHLYTIEQTAPVGAVMGIVPTQFDARQTVHQVNHGFLLKHYADKYTVFKPVRDMAIWRESAQNRQSIYQVAECSKSHNQRRMAKIAAAEIQPILDAIVKAVKS